VRRRRLGIGTDRHLRLAVAINLDSRAIGTPPAVLIIASGGGSGGAEVDRIDSEERGGREVVAMLRRGGIDGVGIEEMGGGERLAGGMVQVGGRGGG